MHWEGFLHVYNTKEDLMLQVKLLLERRLRKAQFDNVARHT
jgi:hypothetical protein